MAKRHALTGYKHTKEHNKNISEGLKRHHAGKGKRKSKGTRERRSVVPETEHAAHSPHRMSHHDLKRITRLHRAKTITERMINKVNENIKHIKEITHSPHHSASHKKKRRAGQSLFHRFGVHLRRLRMKGHKQGGGKVSIFGN
jgi:hypothetical protein